MKNATVSKAKLGMALFVLSEAVFFILLILSLQGVTTREQTFTGVYHLAQQWQEGLVINNGFQVVNHDEIGLLFQQAG